MKLINLTPHDVTLCAEDGSKLSTFKSEGEARVSEATVPKMTIHLSNGLSIDCCTVTYSKVYDLPPPSSDTMYIVSSLVRLHSSHRVDLISPDTGRGSVVRDDAGRIIGVRRFICN